MVRKFPEFSRFSLIFSKSPFFQVFSELYEPCITSHPEGKAIYIIQAIYLIPFSIFSNLKTGTFCVPSLKEIQQE